MLVPSCKVIWQYGQEKSQFGARVRSLNKRIVEHQEKIRLEYEKDFPNQGLITHWETEIRAFEKGIQQALKGLGK